MTHQTGHYESQSIPAMQAPLRKDKPTESWSKAKNKIVAWAAALIGTSVLGWGVFVTVSVYGLQQASAVEADRIESTNRESVARDEAITRLGQQESRAIQAQLAQIQAQLAQIQTHLFSQRNPYGR